MIGSEVGLTGAALYRYFPEGRDEIVAAVRTRPSASWRRVGASRPFTGDAAGSVPGRGQGLRGVRHSDTASYRMLFSLMQTGDFPELRKEARRARDLLFRAAQAAAHSEESVERTCAGTRGMGGDSRGRHAGNVGHAANGLDITQLVDGISRALSHLSGESRPVAGLKRGTTGNGNRRLPPGVPESSTDWQARRPRATREDAPKEISQASGELRQPKMVTVSQSEVAPTHSTRLRNSARCRSFRSSSWGSCGTCKSTAIAPKSRSPPLSRVARPCRRLPRVSATRCLASASPKLTSELCARFPVTTDCISAAGRDKLKRLGIAPPEMHGGDVLTALEMPVTCPYCGSRNTTRRNNFGPTACRAIISATSAFSPSKG